MIGNLFNNGSLPLSTQESLVQGLTGEHRILFELYRDMHEAITVRKYAAVAKPATKLHDLLNNHIHVENIQLYADLKRQLETIDPEKRQVVYGLQRELFSIGRTAIDFIRHAETVSLNAGNLDKFRTDLEGVGTVLTRRIRQEEDFLFPLFVNAMR